jgi:predicted RecA/RadA family phage recombinase
MKNFLQPGKVLTITAAADQTAGDFVVVGSLVGVVANTVESGEENELSLEGVYVGPKAAGASSAATVGAKIYVTSGGVLTITSTSNTFAGYAAEASGDDDTTISVLLARPGS